MTSTKELNSWIRPPKAQANEIYLAKKSLHDKRSNSKIRRQASRLVGKYLMTLCLTNDK